MILLTARDEVTSVMVGMVGFKKPKLLKREVGTSMDKKRGRGRPSITEMIAGENAVLFEKLITDGKKYRSRRSVADAAYVFSAAEILFSEAASDIKVEKRKTTKLLLMGTPSRTFSRRKKFEDGLTPNDGD